MRQAASRTSGVAQANSKFRLQRSEPYFTKDDDRGLNSLLRSESARFRVDIPAGECAAAAALLAAEA